MVEDCVLFGGKLSWPSCLGLVVSSANTHQLVLWQTLCVSPSLSLTACGANYLAFILATQQPPALGGHLVGHLSGHSPSTYQLSPQLIQPMVTPKRTYTSIFTCTSITSHESLCILLGRAGTYLYSVTSSVTVLHSQRLLGSCTNH